ncbi:uncharacterized protein N7498_009428 [Penicillium cinerascens]|uniref:Enoyl reductase (ER) domain-containing protein n=1 Tax=Penicillium cinerascens TaxID=70096 RepID=A0A9W9J5G9_9EURO|nr:uncharacterized protein N7498_009428 [Penicillium cinerascens]KAJ5190443.1 hypothetical protein N7498_009428 [Penicillium cinerascens]
MKALRLTRVSTSSPPILAVSSLPIPQLKPGHALVRIRYASIQPSDRLNAQGLFPSTKFPLVPGRDYSGTVVDIADESQKSWIGKSVYGTSGSGLSFQVDGTHGEYCLVPQAALVEKPASLSFLQAANVGVPFTTAQMCLRRAQVKENDVVLVLGATGAVGSAAVQMARAMGCKRVLRAARRNDSSPNIILSASNPAATLVERIATLTDGKGVDVVIDTVGDLGLMSVAVEQLAAKGRYVWITAPRGDVSKKLSFDVFQAYRKELSLLGCNSVAPPVEDAAEYLRSMHDWIDQGLLEAQKESDYEVVKLGDAIEAGYRKTGKVVIDME